MKLTKKELRSIKYNYMATLVEKLLVANWPVTRARNTARVLWDQNKNKILAGLAYETEVKEQAANNCTAIQPVAKQQVSGSVNEEKDEAEHEKQMGQWIGGWLGLDKP